ncbi:MAG: ATP synthase subunit C [Bacilli bacterium]|jgi:V/A-type H+-transporting ATPase subunit K|nr:ATP synthase subunit C [Bacilli bacterium]MCH4235511.1 ATP synthase subunit C [Bacilli bacterium]HML99912.1 ATP synthase subunit C [Bacilli bacterium]
MEWIVLAFIIAGIALICLPLIKVFKGKVAAVSAKKRVVLHVALFFTLLVITAVSAPHVLGATVSPTDGAALELYSKAAGFGYLGAALSTGLSALGAGIAVAAAAPAAIGAISENPKNLGKSLIFVALGEGVAIYGLLISILILNNIPTLA